MSGPYADYNRPPVEPELGFFDKTFLNTNVIVLVLATLCCSGIMAILSLLGVILCKDPKAKQRALITLIASSIVCVGVNVAQFAAYALPR